MIPAGNTMFEDEDMRNNLVHLKKNGILTNES